MIYLNSTETAICLDVAHRVTLFNNKYVSYVMWCFALFMFMIIWAYANHHELMQITMRLNVLINGTKASCKQTQTKGYIRTPFPPSTAKESLLHSHK